MPIIKLSCYIQYCKIVNTAHIWSFNIIISSDLRVTHSTLVLQFSVWLLSPSQALVEHVRVLDLAPPLHVLLHELQLVQGLQLPI